MRGESPHGVDVVKKVDDRQLALDFLVVPVVDEEPEDVLEEELVPAPEIKLPPGVTLDMDPLDYLRHVVKGREYMIFLCGQNPHICCVRTYSSLDPGKNWWVDRKKAEDVLKGEYDFHSYHVKKQDNGLDLKSRVYLRRG